MVRCTAFVAALLVAGLSVRATDTCQPLPFPSGCAEPRYKPFILLESYRPASEWCCSHYPTIAPVVTRTVVATAHKTITAATATVTKATRTIQGATTTVTAATVTVTAATVTTTVTTATVATNTVATNTVTAEPATVTATTASETAQITNTVATTTVATVTVTVTASESNGAIITLAVPPIVPRLQERSPGNGGYAACQRGDYLCSIFDDLMDATSTFAAYMCSCLQTGWPKPATRTTTVHVTDTVKATVTATVRKTATVTQGATAEVTATAFATATQEATALATATATATATITPTLLVTATVTVTATNLATATATATGTATVTVGCVEAMPTPAGDICGTNYVYIGESDQKVISEGTASTLEGCALSCSETTDCDSLAWSTVGAGGNVGFCNLYDASVAALQSGNLIAVPTIGDQDIMAFYDIGCFICPAAPPSKRSPAHPLFVEPACATVTLTETVERARVQTVVDMRVQTMWQRCAGQ